MNSPFTHTVRANFFQLQQQSIKALHKALFGTIELNKQIYPISKPSVFFLLHADV